MAEPYNPIVRTFGRFRTGLVQSLGVSRHEVRPDTPLETLVPAQERRQVWRQLRQEGLPMPPLELTPRVRGRITLAVLKTAASLAWSLCEWFALLAAIPLGFLAFWATRRQAVQFPLGLTTVGEWVLYLTPVSEHRDSGYRWTRNEIAFKVRLCVAESLGLSLDEVQPESTLEELGAE